MNILSLFDGMSCGQLALKKAGIKYKNYFASEIKKHAIEVTQYNFPNTIQLGDVAKIKAKDLPKIDLLIGGSPCQDLSRANRDRNGLEGKKSGLFWEYIRLYKECKPKYFLLENVVMPMLDQEIITNEFNIGPVLINSSLVSAQNRERLYWTNIKTRKEGLFEKIVADIPQPKDKGILLQDILESGYVIKGRKKARALLRSDGSLINKTKMWHRYNDIGFSTLVCESQEFDINNLRSFTQMELEKLQTVPVGYTQILKKIQALDLIADGWTIDIIAHIFKYLL